MCCQVVEALVERGADVTLLNEDGKGALDLASNYLRLSVLSKYPKSPAHSAVAVIKAAWQGDIVSLKNLLVNFHLYIRFMPSKLFSLNLSHSHVSIRSTHHLFVVVPQLKL